MKNLLLLIPILSMVFMSCDPKDKDKDKVDFDKKTITTNIADNYILPSYQDLKENLDSLSSSWSNYVATPNTTNFDIVKNTWKAAYLSFQRVKFIDFGPAMDNGFNASAGVFPSDTTGIENNITAGTYDLTTMSNMSAIGFSALDYLFYRANAETDMQSSANRRAYVSDVINKMTNDLAAVIAAWNSYRNTFVDGVGTSTTDPFSLFVNGFCKDFELAKNAKIGIPIGKHSLGITRPEYLEARYSKFGKELLLENIKALKAVFNGNSGAGFDDYLVALEKQSLATTIQTNFDQQIAKVNTFSTDLEAMMTSDFQSLDDLYTMMQGAVVNIKTDMTGAFGILITYQDNDGD